jgi:hypothetical protein
MRILYEEKVIVSIAFQLLEHVQLKQNDGDSRQALEDPEYGGYKNAFLGIETTQDRSGNYFISISFLILPVLSLDTTSIKEGLRRGSDLVAKRWVSH